MWSTGERIGRPMLDAAAAGATWRRVYELDPAPLAELDDWLAPYRELWDARLDALGRHLDAVHKED
jgi:hypothetical protein